MKNTIPKAGGAKGRTTHPPLEIETKATASNGETTNKDSLTKSDPQNSRSISQEQSVQKELAPNNERPQPKEQSTVLSFDDLPVEVIQNILRFADEIKEKLPSLSYVNARTLQIALDTPELMQQQLKLEQALSGKGGEDYLTVIKQHLPIVRAREATLRLPNNLTLENYNELATLLRGSSQRPTIVVANEPAELYQRLGKNGARFIIRLPSAHEIKMQEQAIRALKLMLEQTSYENSSIWSRYAP